MSSTIAVIDVVSNGARGDGIVDDTKAFEVALESLKRTGGGMLRINANRIYRIRPIHIQTSHLIFHLEDNVTLLGIANANLWPLVTPLPSYGIGPDFAATPNHFRHASLLHGEKIHNITFQGEGYNSVIDGSGSYWWKRFWNSESNVTRPHLMEFQYSSHIKFYNLRLKDSPFWNWHMFDCEHVHVKHMWIESPDDSPNTDGWDPSSCRHVLIEDSSYQGGDDCVAIKSGYDCFGVWYNTPSQYIHVRNVTCQGRVAGSVALGSELSGGIQHVLIENISFPGMVKKPVTIKTGSSRGGLVSNVTFRDITVSGTLQHPAIHLDMLEYSPETCIFRDCRNPACPIDWKPPQPPQISNVSILRMNGMEARLEWNETFHFAALESSSIGNLYLQDIHFPPSATWFCRGPIHGQAVSVFPGPACFGTGASVTTTMNNASVVMASAGSRDKFLILYRFIALVVTAAALVLLGRRTKQIDKGDTR